MPRVARERGWVRTEGDVDSEHRGVVSAAHGIFFCQKLYSAACSGGETLDKSMAEMGKARSNSHKSRRRPGGRREELRRVQPACAEKWSLG